MRWCTGWWLTHSWTKWSDAKRIVEERSYFPKAFPGEYLRATVRTFEFVRYVQRRECRKCGIQQERQVTR